MRATHLALSSVLAAALNVGFADGARAEGAPLLPGTGVPPIASGFGGTSLLTQGSNTFSNAGLSGTLYWQVWSDSANSVLVGNEFVYWFDVGGTQPVARMTINNWDGATTAVAWNLTGGSPHPDDPGPRPLGSVVPIEADRATNGNSIGWDFPGIGINPGGGSSYLIVFTDSATIGPAMANFIDGATASTATVAVIPEPEVYAMLLAGFGLLGFLARRRAVSTN